MKKFLAKRNLPHSDPQMKESLGVGGDTSLSAKAEISSDGRTTNASDQVQALCMKTMSSILLNYLASMERVFSEIYCLRFSNDNHQTQRVLSNSFVFH